MRRFSANLGFLWRELALPDATRAAAAAGFDAVECHWPYDVAPSEIKAALSECGLPMISLNTRRGDADLREMGLAALPGRGADARAGIDEAVAYAAEVGASAVHVMAGKAAGPAAFDAFVNALDYACRRGAEAGLTILIEPLNRHDAPGYFLSTTDRARNVIDTVGAANLKLMFDCYHVGRSEGDITTRLADLAPIIGHIQFASVPDRGRPDSGEVNFPYIFEHAEALGLNLAYGAEYSPNGPTEATLGWLPAWR